MNSEIIGMVYPQVRQELDQVWKNAKPYMASNCRVCKVCNSAHCGMIPTERAGSAERNYQQLQHVKLIYDTIYEGGDGSEIDTSIDLFGHTFRAPVMCAPFGHVKSFNPTTRFPDDYTFNLALQEGCRQTGIFAWTPDTLGEEVFTGPLKALKEHGGIGIPAIKSWSKEEIQSKIRLCEDAGVMAIGHDIDCIGLPYLSINGNGATYPKSVEQLKDIFSITNVPFILKGVMSVRGALKALDTGAAGIVVSNHAGNTMDQSLATCEVLPAIKAAVGNKMTILVDGGVRHGEDVYKMLALGADAVMIGRPYLIAAEGGEARGVALYSQKIIWELQNAMRMSGCRTLKDITRDHVVTTNTEYFGA